MADRLAVMHQGILQQVGAPEEVYNLPVNRFVAGFLGDANFIDGTVTENGLFRSHFGEFQLAPTAFRPETGRKITAAIRPERSGFAPRKQSAGNGSCWWTMCSRPGRRWPPQRKRCWRRVPGRCSS